MLRFQVPLLFALLGGTTASAQTTPAQEPPVVVAQGEAIVRQAPDVAWVQVSVEARGAKPEEARQRAADAMTSVLATLKPIAPPANLRTSGLSVTPEMDFTTGGSRLKGYLARNQVEARVDNLELPVEGHGRVDRFGRDVDHRSAVRREGARAARARGASQCRSGCDGARPGDRGRRGRTLGPIVRIQEQRMSSTPYRVGLAGGGGGRGGQQDSTPISPGEIEIRAVVVLTASIK